VASSGFHESVDGGETFKDVPWGGDNHDIWIDPKNPDHFALTNDGGLMITTVHGRGFHRVSLVYRIDPYGIVPLKLATLSPGLWSVWNWGCSYTIVSLSFSPGCPAFTRSWAISCRNSA